MTQAQATPPAAGHPEHPNPQLDFPSWWSYYSADDHSWRWSTSPRLYFPAGLEYTPGERPFTVIDGMGREQTYERPFECYIEPFTGKVQRLHVQAPDSLCRLPAKDANATWGRTPMRNATSILIRISELPFRLVDPKRRDDVSLFTFRDWLVVAPMWIVTVVLFFFAWLALTFGVTGAPEGKERTKYLPLLFRGLRYPRLARNVLENRAQVAKGLHNHRDLNGTLAIPASYRTFRPRFLNYLVEIERNGRITHKSERRPVGVDDLTPFVLVAYSSEHYNIQPEGESQTDGSQSDLEALLAVATKATAKYFNPLPGDLGRHPKAFWLSANCMPYDKLVDQHGNAREVDEPEREALENQDTYSICDIVRAAEHVIVVAGNMLRPWDNNALRVWGERVWTLPEIVLSKGDLVTVWHCGRRPPLPSAEPSEIRKPVFPFMAWPDPLNSRQLIEHYSNLHLSRLEFVKIALGCLMSRKLKTLHPGDRSYVLMGLLRSRPPIDKSDSAFQAFARLSLPQDSDRLMERLICLLPEKDERSWELMTDQYKASLWDIYPDTQVCGIGENDTVIVDGAFGAQIQWSKFSEVRFKGNLTIKRQLFVYFVMWSPMVFFLGVLLAATNKPQDSVVPSNFRGITTGQPEVSGPYKAGISLMAISLGLFIIPAPYYIAQLYSGKLWEVEPCFLGVEGYVPIEIIERQLFGTRSMKRPRLRWSPYGSPLSRHTEGELQYERSVRYSHDLSDDSPTPSISSVFSVPTYAITPLNPTEPCPACPPQASSAPRYCANHPTVASLQDMSRSPMGELKPFTLVDTFNMSVTLFYAVRPPTVLVIGGAEGGMKRAIACSFDVSTGTLFRETVLRIPSRSVSCMERLPRVRIGLKRTFLPGDVQPAPTAAQQVAVGKEMGAGEGGRRG